MVTISRTVVMYVVVMKRTRSRTHRMPVTVVTLTVTYVQIVVADRRFRIRRIGQRSSATAQAFRPGGVFWYERRIDHGTMAVVKVI